MRHHWSALVLACCLLTALPAHSLAADTDWRRYDLNKDGKFDEADKKIIFKSGLWAPTIDVNGDKRKDIADAFALLLLQTAWDRNADMAVSADDFTPQPPLDLPKPDATAATALVAASMQELAGKVPADLDEKLQREWEPLKIVTAPDRAALYEESGALALAQRNLDVAQWAYGKACQLAPGRDSVYANLAFTLAQKGRYRDALVLLAYARQRYPKSGTTSNNIGWSFARNGQLDLARQYYQEAIGWLPFVAQYHLNLGIVLLRVDDRAGARAQFDLAAKLAPNDRDALFMALATNPPPPAKLEDVQARYEREQAEFNKTASEDEKQTTRWDELGNEEKIDQVIQQAADRVHREKDQALKDLTDEMRKRIWDVADPAVPQWKSAMEDFKRWRSKGQSAYDAVQQAIADGDKRAAEIATQYKRKEAAAILEAGPQVLQLALAEAQSDMAGYTSGQQARQAFEKTVDRLYTQPMARAQEQMAKGRDTAYLDLRPDSLDATVLTSAAFMPIVARAASDAQYGGDFLKKKDEFPLFNIKTKVQGLDEPTFGLSIGVVGVEWNAQDNEFKLQAGQGLIAAGTWSPDAGFGFQLGVGVDISEGPLKAKAGNFIKFGSDGSISVDYEGGASVGAGPIEMGWSNTLSSPIRAAMYEPVGTLN